MTCETLRAHPRRRSAPTGLPAGAQPGSGKQPSLEVYVGQVDAADLEAIHGVGLDHEDVSTGKGQDGKMAVEVVMNHRQADKLASQGVELEVKTIGGKNASEVAAAQAEEGYQGFRSWSEAGGIEDELRETAAANPTLTKLVPYGETVDGQDLLALKVSKNAGREPDGRKPAVLYLGAQYAREWITPEMVRRPATSCSTGSGRSPTSPTAGRTQDLNPYDVVGTEGAPFEGFTGDLNGPGSAENQEHTASLVTTSSFLPIDDFPQFASQAVVDWARPGASPFDPRTGWWFVYSQQADVAYKRLTKTIDLTEVSDQSTAELRF